MRAIGIAAGAIALALGLGSAGAASAEAPQQASGEPRIRDLEYRWRSLDNSEQVEESAEAKTVILSADVLFAFDKADLTPEAQSRIEELATELAELGSRTVTIDGHSDATGDPTYNQDLSQRRAESVRTALESKLSGGFTFEVAGHGEDEPVADNETPEGQAKNRRVEIHYPTD